MTTIDGAAHKASIDAAVSAIRDKRIGCMRLHEFANDLEIREIADQAVAAALPYLGEPVAIVNSVRAVRSIAAIEILRPVSVGAALYLAPPATQQRTKCAQCGEVKHTPLRIDWLGGYICLTCADKALEAAGPLIEQMAKALKRERAALPHLEEPSIPEGSYEGTFCTQLRDGYQVEKPTSPLKEIISGAISETEQRHPNLRGPWKFGEDFFVKSASKSETPLSTPSRPTRNAAMTDIPDDVRAAAIAAYQAGTHEAIVKALLAQAAVLCDLCRYRAGAIGAAPCNRCIRFDRLEIGDPTP